MDDLRKRAESLVQKQPEESSRLSPDETQRLIHELRTHQIELELQNEELRRTQAALEVSRNRYVDLYDFAPLGYLAMNEHGLITEANLTCATMFGRDRSALLKLSLAHLIVKEDGDAYFLHCRKILDTKTPQSCELRMQRKDGTHFHAHLECRPVLDREEHVTQIRIAVTDISELTALVQEKELLMKEILHRTKNNMAMIVSLLNLQAADIEDTYVVQMFQDAGARIQSMALVQEKLYKSKNFAKLDFQDYLMDLAYTVVENYRTNQGEVALTFDLEPMTVSTDTAIHCGLILSELLTNVLKYAFPSTGSTPSAQTNAIGILLHAGDGGEIELGLRDNGVGLPEDLDVRNSDSLGLQLVTLLAEGQLRGTIEIIKREQGTEFLIRFRPTKT